MTMDNPTPEETRRGLPAADLGLLARSPVLLRLALAALFLAGLAVRLIDFDEPPSTFTPIGSCRARSSPGECSEALTES